MSQISQEFSMSMGHKTFSSPPNSSSFISNFNLSWFKTWALVPLTGLKVDVIDGDNHKMSLLYLSSQHQNHRPGRMQDISLLCSMIGCTCVDDLICI